VSGSRASKAGGGPPPSQRSIERNLGRRRARHAWDWVAQAQGLGDKYTTLARKLPNMLQTSGLGQTLAFLYGKGCKDGRPNLGKAEGRLLDQLHRYLGETQKRTTADPMELLLSLSSTEYRTATREIAAVAEWLKRFAEGKSA
jgi:CRISPR-associated protein Cmr5